jgi:hypothetical protein
MARIRTIKPSFYLDEDLGTISRDARLLYIGLWNHSDDRGVFEWRPGKIKVEIFPYDSDVNKDLIDKWLKQLESINNIIYFDENGKPYGYIPTFLNHQKVDKPSESQYLTKTLPEVPNSLSRSESPIPLGVVMEGNSKGREKESKGIIYIEKKVYGAGNNISLSNEQYQKLKDKFGEQPLNLMIDELSAYRKLKDHPDHYLTLNNWLNRELKKQNKTPVLSSTGIRVNE